MIDDINEDVDDENQTQDSTPKQKWYLIDSEGTFYKLWDFLITQSIIYCLFVTPFLLVFHCLLSCYLCNEPNDQGQITEGDCECIESETTWIIREIEFGIDMIWFVNIIINFLKMTTT